MLNKAVKVAKPAFIGLGVVGGGAIDNGMKGDWGEAARCAFRVFSFTKYANPGRYLGVLSYQIQGTIWM